MSKLRNRFKLSITGAICILLSVIASTPASANVGIPLITLISPGLWLILPLVILLEGFIALFILRKGIWTALRVAGITNIVSTILGVPLRWLLVFLLTPYANQQSDLGYKYASGTIMGKFAFTILNAPWGFTGTSHELLICWGILLVPFLFLSVWIEGQVAIKLVAKEHRKQARRWAWIANIVSYTLLFLMFSPLFSFMWNWLDRPWR